MKNAHLDSGLQSLSAHSWGKTFKHNCSNGFVIIEKETTASGLVNKQMGGIDNLDCGCRPSCFIIVFLGET